MSNLWKCMLIFLNKPRKTWENIECLAANSDLLNVYIFILCPPPFLWLCRSYFGREYEVICHTYLDSHRVEEDKNYWVIVTANPSDDGTMIDRPDPQPGGIWKKGFCQETREYKNPRLQMTKIDEILILIFSAQILVWEMFS